MSQRTPESEELYVQFMVSNQNNISKLISMLEQQMIYINSYFFVSKNSIDKDQDQQKIQPIDNQSVSKEDQTLRDKDPIN